MTDDTPVGLTKVCTVKILKTRIYPIDPEGDVADPDVPAIFVSRGSEFPVYRDQGDLYFWVMTGVRNNRVGGNVEKIGDGMFTLNQGYDAPSGEPVTARSRSYDLAGFKAFLNDPLCQMGPQQRWSFRLDGPLPTGQKDDILDLFEDMVDGFLYNDRKGPDNQGVPVGVVQEAVRAGELTVEEMIEEFGTRLRKALKP
jgi:hypothetical protein